MTNLGEEQLKSTLIDFGCTSKEAQIYLFLAKTGILKGSEVSKYTKTNKAETYRILKNLQGKGLVESTMESPTRFSVVPLDKIIDTQIKERQAETSRIQNAREQLLTYWNSIKRTELELTLEKFVVLDKNKINLKIGEMMRGSKNSFFATTTVQMLGTDKGGLFETATDKVHKKVVFRFLTDINERNVDAAQNLSKITPPRIILKARNPLVTELFPRMAIRDNEELLLFISPENTEKEETALWTNSHSIVNAFASIFEDLWEGAFDLHSRILEIKMRNSSDTTQTPKEQHMIKSIYQRMLREAKISINLNTSASGLQELIKESPILMEAAKKGVSIKIVAPIIDENLESAKKLGEYCQIRHTEVEELGNTVIDNKFLFQFGPRISFTNNYQSVDRMNTTLETMWKNAPPPMFIEWEIDLATKLKTPLSSAYYSDKKIVPDLFDLSNKDSAGEALQKTVDAMALKSWKKQPTIGYVTIGQAIFRPPNQLKTPFMGVRVVHFNEDSGFGEGSNVVVHLWLETPPGYSMVPVAVLADSEKEALINQKLLAGTPAAKNITVAEPREFQMIIRDDVLFVGWTVDLPLYPMDAHLAPSSFMIQAKGAGKRITRDFVGPAGFKSHMEYTHFHAVATFLNTSAQYVVSGIQGRLSTDCVFTTVPP